MATKLPLPAPHGELRWAREPGASHAQLSAMAKRGAAVRLAPGLYVAHATLPVEQVVAHHSMSIVAGVWPGAVLCGRSAFSGGMPIQGKLYVCANDPTQRRSTLKLPGLTVIPVEGPAPLPGDMPIPGGLYLSSPVRGLVENIAGRGRPAPWKAGNSAVEDKMDELARTGGAGRIQNLLSQLDVIAGSFDPAAVGHVRQRLSALLGSFDRGALKPTSPRLAARLAGAPYDAHRIEMLTELVNELEGIAPRPLHLTPPQQRWQWLPFYEAYFSNFIEGTEFGVDEARIIAVEGHVPQARPADAHDVTATYRLAVDNVDRIRVPRNGTELIEILCERHAILMAARPDKSPGLLKSSPVFAGGYEFVQPELLVGTLERGFEAINGLVDPFSRAVAMMILVTECHPFLDGNGRVARLAMNAELSAAGQVRICIPTVFRPEYISALSAFSNGAGRGQSLISVLEFAQRWTAAIDWSTFEIANEEATVCNAFVDPDVAMRNGQRLLMPSSR